MGKRIDDLPDYGSYDIDKMLSDIFEVSKNSGTAGSPIYATDGSRQIKLSMLAALIKLAAPEGIGHYSGSVITDRDAIVNKKAGDFFYLTSSIVSAGTIAGTRPSTICIVDELEKIYIFDQTFITIIDGTNNSVLATVAIPFATTSRFLCRDESRIFFTSVDGGFNATLYYIDINTDTVSGAGIPVGNNANTGIRYKNRIYVGAQSDGIIYIIDISGTNFALVTTKVLARTFTFGVDTDRDKIYCFSDTLTSVSIIDYNIDDFTGVTIPVPANTLSCSSKTNKDPWIYFNNKLVALSKSSAEVRIINTETDDIDNTFAVGTTPIDAELYSCTLFVACFGSDDLYPIDIQENVVGTPIPIGNEPCAAGGMAIKNSKLFIPCFGASSADGGIFVVDVILMKVEESLLTGNQVRNIGISNLNKVYTSSQLSNHINSYIYTFARLFTLQEDLETWADITPINKAGDFSEGVINYSKDFSHCFSDFSLIPLGFTKALIKLMTPALVTDAATIAKLIDESNWDDLTGVYNISSSPITNQKATDYYCTPDTEAIRYHYIFVTNPTTAVPSALPIRIKFATDINEVSGLEVLMTSQLWQNADTGQIVLVRAQDTDSFDVKPLAIDDIKYTISEYWENEANEGVKVILNETDELEIMPDTLLSSAIKQRFWQRPDKHIIKITIDETNQFKFVDLGL